MEAGQGSNFYYTTSDEDMAVVDKTLIKHEFVAEFTLILNPRRPCHTQGVVLFNIEPSPSLLQCGSARLDEGMWLAYCIERLGRKWL